MNSRYFFLTFLALIFLGSSLANSQTVASSSNYHGQEIQKIIDYLRSINETAAADNIEKYLNNSQIIVKSLDDGALGENDAFGGPIYVDPQVFNNPKIPWNVSKTGDVNQMISIAVTLIHEKYHSEHHTAWGRISSNGGYALGGGNAMEVEGWTAGLNFLNQVINKTLERANASTTSLKEKEELLALARLLLSNKMSRVEGYNENKYGPEFWNATELRRIRDGVDGEIEKVKNQSRAASVGAIINQHNALEGDIKSRQSMYKTESSGKMERDSQDYAFKMVQIASLGKNRSSELPLKLGLNIGLDTNDEFSAKNLLFTLNYPGNNGEIDVFQDIITSPQLYLFVNQSTVTQVYLDSDSIQKATDLITSGKIIVSEAQVGPQPVAAVNEPLGRQFEDACGNGVLDRGEQCDYGYACPERMICSHICDCVYPVENPTGDLQPLPPREPLQPDENGNYWSYITDYNNNIAKLPSYVREILANEVVVIKITDQNENVFTYSAVIKNKRLESITKGEPTSPTLRVSLDEKTIEKINRSTEPLNAVIVALNNGDIKFEPLTPANQFKVFMANFGAKLFAILKQSKFNVKPGDSVQINYYGRDATLVGNPHKLKIVIIKNEPIMPVIGTYGLPIAYTNNRAQQVIKQTPQRFSPNAGIYNQPVHNYRTQWARSSRIELPDYGTPYQPSGVFTTGFSTGGRYLSAIGGYRG